MDLENLDIKVIEDFSYCYRFASLKFEKNIKNPNKQEKIRKWMYKNQLNHYDFPTEITEQLESLNDNEFISLFKSCCDFIEENGTALEQKIAKDLEGFPKDVTNAMLNLFRHEYYVKNDFKKSDNTFEIVVDSSAAHNEKLILFDAEFSTEEFDTLFFSEAASLIKENGIYKLTVKGSLFEKEDEFEVTVFFTSAKTEIEVFNPTNSFLDNSPWEQLFCLSNSIICKEDLKCNLNSSELKILPLLKEIQNLFLLNEENKSFPLLKNLIKKHGAIKLLPLIEKLESPTLSEKRKAFLSSKLTNRLNFIKYKSLWQEIYELIFESQKEYPTYIEIYKSKATITKFKNKVTALMNERGYTGEYPLFFKKSPIKGIHLFNSYNTSYTVGFHKNTVHYIMCEENLDEENRIYINLVHGSEFLKRNEEMSDFHSCRFNSKGKKFSDYIMFYDDFDEGINVSLEERIDIAVKLTELKKLSKDERQKICSSYSSFKDKLITFLLVFSLGGFGFATLFIPAMMGFSALMLWLDGLPVDISDIPWLAMYFECWIYFGGPAGIATVLSTK